MNHNKIPSHNPEQPPKPSAADRRDTAKRNPQISKLRKLVGATAVSPEHLIRRIDTGEAKMPLPGKDEDAIVNEPTMGLIGVFDGMGGHSYGKEAANAAARVTKETIQEGLQNAGGSFSQRAQAEYWVHQALLRSNETVIHEAPGGGTTACIAVMSEENGRQVATIGSVGDSRAYIFDPFTGHIARATEDEGEGHRLYNAIGTKNMEIKQIRSYDVTDKMLILVTDGITGDYQADLVSGSEIAGAVQGSISAQEAAERTLALARKRDDRSVVTARP